MREASRIRRAADPSSPTRRRVIGLADEPDRRVSWQAWNDYATEFADATGARVVHIDDGGIAGPAFHDRALRLNAPVLMSPKRYTDTLPARLRTRPVVDPCPLWCWSLVTRVDDDRETIAALREHAGAVARTAGLHAVPAGPTWLPSRDPHRNEIASPPA